MCHTMYMFVLNLKNSLADHAFILYQQDSINKYIDK